MALSFASNTRSRSGHPRWRDRVVRLVMVGAVSGSTLACSSETSRESTPANLTAQGSSVPAPPAPATVRSTPTPQAQTFTVGNTLGKGVYLRRTPDWDDTVRAWADGTVMVEIGRQVTAGDTAWRNVEDPDGNRGWVPDQFLVPAGASTPSATATPVPPAAGPTPWASPSARVTGTDGCLRIRNQPSLGAEILECVIDGAWLRDNRENREADGHTWLSVTTEAGVKGWASTEYLKR